MKKGFFLLFSLLSILSANENKPSHTEKKKVLISQVVDHPALNMTTNGIIDALSSNGFKRGENIEIRVESAQANGALASQIASKFINQNPDVVVGVGTLSAQSFARYRQKDKIQILFSSVTDPQEAGLVNHLNEPNKNISGVSNFVALLPQIELFKKIQPDLKNLGILYNPGEINSVSILNKLDALSSSMGITITKQAVAKTADVAQASIKLSKICDAIYISNDNTALSSLQIIIKIANESKTPVYVSDTAALSLGALAALGPSQYEIGLQTGGMIVRSLKGEDVGMMPVEFPNKTELFINLKAAKILGIIIPDALQKSATQIVKEAQQ